MLERDPCDICPVANCKVWTDIQITQCIGLIGMGACQKYARIDVPGEGIITVHRETQDPIVDNRPNTSLGAITVDVGDYL